MSNVQSQIDRIRNNIEAAYIALEALGITVPEGATVDELAALINDAAAAHLDDVIANRIVQTTGAATDKVMSQKAVTEAFAQKAYLVTVFEDLKAAIAESNIDAAIAVLDKAILDFSALS